MGDVVIHPHVLERHLDLTGDDVLGAWDNARRWVTRSRSSFDETVAVGIADSGKTLEMAAVFREDGTWLVYHAMCPPTNGTLKEVGLK